MILLEKMNWKVIKQSKDEKYQYLFQETYKNLESYYHVRENRWIEKND